MKKNSERKIDLTFLIFIRWRCALESWQLWSAPIFRAFKHSKRPSQLHKRTNLARRAGFRTIEIRKCQRRCTNNYRYQSKSTDALSLDFATREQLGECWRFKVHSRKCFRRKRGYKSVKFSACGGRVPPPWLILRRRCGRF